MFFSKNRQSVKVLRWDGDGFLLQEDRERHDHKHKVGADGWTVQDNLKWRQEYAPDILADIRELLDKMLARTDILPKSDLAEAIGYLDMEWDAVVDIFKRGDTNKLTPQRYDKSRKVC